MGDFGDGAGHYSVDVGDDDVDDGDESVVAVVVVDVFAAVLPFVAAEEEVSLAIACLLRLVPSLISADGPDKFSTTLRLIHPLSTHGKEYLPELVVY